MARNKRERERAQQHKEQKRAKASKQASERQLAADDASAMDEEQLADAAAFAAEEERIAALTSEIADRLGETEDEPVGQIERAVRILGPETTLAILDEAFAVEAQGGLMIRDGSRRRTLGGVFFYLLQRRISKSDRLSIFYPEYQQIVPLAPDEIIAHLTDAGQWASTQSSKSSILVNGRPSVIPPPDIPHETPWAVVMMESGPERSPPFGKGMLPPHVATTFRILISARRWPNAAKALIENPDARMHVAGQTEIDPQSPDIITVRAHTVTISAPQYHKKEQKALEDSAPAIDESLLLEQTRENEL